jgi:[glutamine synthetase] adenylyltransferase / [glutamine synthetase]-adenylyl-L-tyrosine phosphorylase
MMDRPTPADFNSAFERTLRLSPFVARTVHARPGLVDELERHAGQPFTREDMRAALADGPDAAAMGSRLRSLRARVMVRLAHRDLAGEAPLDEVFATMSALADECIGAAVREAQSGHDFAPGGGLIVAALGKLGGEELNVSSDVDLVFLHGDDGNGETFAKVGKAVIALLAETTAEGQAFRVDMRLRPFGDSGPLVASLNALEEYFVTHARPWERYAWLKARVICGRADGVTERVQPFVYRRYLDYGMLEALRDMHGRIFEAAVQRRKAADIKVGAGGIREIEFAAQLFQIVRGGRDAALRTASTRAALQVIAERALLDPARVVALRAAYDFLRRLEHRLQYYDDQQTQALPRTPEHQALIAEAMGFADYAALTSELDAHRAHVQETFNALFEDAQGADSTETRLAAWLFDPQATPDPEGLAESLAAAGIEDSPAVAARLIEFTRSRRYRAMSAASRAKVEKLLPALVATAAAEGGNEATTLRLIALLEAIDRRDAYFSLLLEHPQVLRRAASLMSKSAWAARLLARHPILLDELTRTAASFTATDWKAERGALAAECATLAGDPEGLLDHLRHFKQRHVLRLTIADLEGELPVMALSDELSALADAILAVTLDEAAKSLGVEGAGARPQGGEEATPAITGFCIVGYGKLGGKELGYGSDLDIIFVYDETCPVPPERLARVAQRVITWLTSLTAAGVLYDIDVRLRPDGEKGLLVSSLSAFRDYQLKRAWTWEHQALTRARYCAGDATLGARFEALRDQILATPRERAKLWAEIVEMRRKIRADRKHDPQDIKYIEGGVVDLEFCVQALVLLEGPNHPALRENKGNHTLLRRAGALGLLDDAAAVAAADAYLALRARAHRAALNDEEKVKLAPGELAPEREAVTRLRQALFG